MQVQEVVLQSCLIVLPRHAVHAGRGMALERQERIAQQIDREVVQQRGELLLLPRIGALISRAGLPLMSFVRGHTQSGGLVSYGPDLVDLYRRAGAIADRLLKGAVPAELPIEQPTKFELVVNVKAAKALGLTVASSVLLRADEVIE